MTSITDELRELTNDPLLGYASQEQHIERLNAIADAVEQELVERYVAKPLDADGVPINVGDKMVGPYLEPSYVDGVGVGVFFVYDGESMYHGYDAQCYRHYQCDTWERIIEDALGSRWSAPNELSSDFTALVARCKKLAGDAS